MSPNAVGVHPSLIISGSMASKRSESKDIVESATGDAVEQASMSFPIYEDTKLIVDKDIKLKWQEVNDAFVGTFGEDLEDFQVYANIHKSGLYWIACTYPVFPCAYIIHWIVSHTNLKMMTLSSTSGTQLATFRIKNYHQMYRLL